MKIFTKNIQLSFLRISLILARKRNWALIVFVFLYTFFELFFFKSNILENPNLSGQSINYYLGFGPLMLSVYFINVVFSEQWVSDFFRLFHKGKKDLIINHAISSLFVAATLFSTFMCGMLVLIFTFDISLDGVFSHFLSLLSVILYLIAAQMLMINFSFHKLKLIISFFIVYLSYKISEIVLHLFGLNNYSYVSTQILSPFPIGSDIFDPNLFYLGKIYFTLIASFFIFFLQNKTESWRVYFGKKVTVCVFTSMICFFHIFNVYQSSIDTFSRATVENKDIKIHFPFENVVQQFGSAPKELQYYLWLKNYVGNSSSFNLLDQSMNRVKPYAGSNNENNDSRIYFNIENEDGKKSASLLGLDFNSFKLVVNEFAQQTLGEDKKTVVTNRLFPLLFDQSSNNKTAVMSLLEQSFDLKIANGQSPNLFSHDVVILDSNYGIDIERIKTSFNNGGKIILILDGHQLEGDKGIALKREKPVLKEFLNSLGVYPIFNHLVLSKKGVEQPQDVSELIAGESPFSVNCNSINCKSELPSVYLFRPDEYSFIAPNIFQVREMDVYDYQYLISVTSNSLLKVPVLSPVVRLDKALSLENSEEVTDDVSVVLKIINNNKGEIIIIGDRDIFEVNGNRGANFNGKSLLEMTGGKILVGSIFNLLYGENGVESKPRKSLSVFLLKQFQGLLPIVKEKNIELKRLKEYETFLVMNASQSGGLRNFQEKNATEFKELEANILDTKKKINIFIEGIFDFISIFRIKSILFVLLNLLFVSSFFFILFHRSTKKRRVY